MSDKFVLANKFGEVVVVRPSDYNWETYLLLQQQGGQLPTGAAVGTQEQMDQLKGTIIRNVGASYGNCYRAPGKTAEDYSSLQVVAAPKPSGQMG